MYALATTRVDILRGTRVDDVGSTVDTDDVHLSGVIAALIERDHAVWDAATQQRRTVRQINLTLPSGTDVLTTDRVRDLKDGALYSVQSVTAPKAVGIVPDLDVVLVRVTSTGP